MATAGRSPSNPPPAADQSEHPAAQAKPRWPWLKNLTPFLVVLLAAAIVFTVTRNWNAWEGGKAEQVTDDAIVRGDVTPLSTKVAGLVRDVKVADYQRVRAGELLVQLQDDDYQAQAAQAKAAVAAAKAAITDNEKQRALQDSRIAKALSGVDLAKARITAAKAGLDAVQADVTRTSLERTRQEALLASDAATKETVEKAQADQERFAAEQASRKADLVEAETALRSSEIEVDTERKAKDVLVAQEQQLFADLQAKQAALTTAEVNLSYTKIVAPGDGTVGERQVRPGQLVSPGTQVLAFVPDTKWVQANYRETQLTNMKVGDPAVITVDAYPGKSLQGKVIEIAPASGSQFALLPPDNATGNYTKVVQRVPVKIALDDAKTAAELRPGLSVVATVRTAK
jgi:membrane fusion protein, multidrug efflux system